MTSSSPTYRIPERTVRTLNEVVDGIVARPGPFVDSSIASGVDPTAEMRAVVRSLPDGFTEDNLVDAVRLALLTECATASYSAVFSEGARRWEAGWLGRFNDEVWTPDEMTHHEPFKIMLLGIGLSESEVDRQVRETQEKAYYHACGDTPIHLTTFGMVQEYLTDHWYSLISAFVEPAAPSMAAMVRQVKRRETLHTVWYRDLTAIQLKDSPELMSPVAETLVRFQMPSNVLVPEIQAQVQGWMSYMNVNFEQMLRDLTRIMLRVSGSGTQLAKLLLDLAAQRGLNYGPVSSRMLTRVLNLMGGAGYGVIGEAILQRTALTDIAEGAPRRAERGPRAILRNWLAHKLDVRLDAAPA